MSSDQLREYRSQLADIEELLADDATDESLLKLKTDLVELIALTEEETGDPATEERSVDVDETLAIGIDERLPVSEAERTIVSNADATTTPAPGSESVSAANDEPARKKLKKLKDFEIPAHLQILETDTEKEIIRKKRTLKSLKSKHREKQREYESSKKQQSWQSFNKKANKKSSGSIFATHDGVHSKVGVVSAASTMTESEERK